MKDKNILDALGEIDPSFIKEAAPERLPDASAKVKGRRVHWRRWIPAVAAILTVVILLGTLLGGVPGILPSDGEGETTTGGFTEHLLQRYQLLAATYPAMAKCPTDEPDSVALKAWMQEMSLRRAYFGAGSNLDEFFERTVSQFLSDAGTENVVYSPLNVYMALAMLAETAAGESRQQILDLLNCDSIEALRTQVHAIWNANYMNDGRSTSILANSVWLDEDIPYVRETLQTLAEQYYASSFQGQMGSEEYNQVLHGWMNDQTGGALKDQINGIKMSPFTVFALVSTVCFEGGWGSPFSEKAVTDGVFHGALGDTECEMMSRRLNEYNYCWGDRFTVVGLGMSSGSMDFILPDEGVSVEELLTDAQALQFIVSREVGSRCKAMDVNLSIPKFDVESQMDLIKDLKALGVTDCFDDEKADFSAMTTLPESIAVGKIQHGVRVTVNEQGAKAVAYTFIDFPETGVLPEELEEIDFIVDRPFIFVIRNAEGLPLFVGVVNQVNK